MGQSAARAGPSLPWLEAQFTVDALPGVSHLYELLVQVDVRPSQTEQLAAPQAEVDSKHVERVQTVGLRIPQKGPRLISAQPASDLVRRRGEKTAKSQGL
jgi:hypothetical protein